MGRKDVSFWRASSPSPAASVVKPQVRTSSVRPRRVLGSSSTTRTRSVEVVVTVQGAIVACRFYTVQQIHRMSSE